MRQLSTNFAFVKFEQNFLNNNVQQFFKQQCTTESNYSFQNSIPYTDFNLVSGEEKKSTKHAILSIVEEIRKNLDNGILHAESSLILKKLLILSTIRFYYRNLNIME